MYVSFRKALLPLFLCSGLASSAASIRFEGPEIFPIDPRIEQLTVADLDGDSLLDMVIVNPRKSKLQLLFNQTGKSDSGSLGLPKEVNRLPMDARFRLESISAEERISSVVVTDFSGNGKQDIIYCGNLDEVILLESRGKQGWIETEKWQIPNIVAGANSLQLGDFDGDSSLDVVVLTETFVYFVQSRKNGRASRLRKLSHSGDLESFVVLDVNHDGADDLIGRSSGDPQNSFIRLGGKQGVSSSEFLAEVGLNRFLGVMDASRGQLGLVSQRSGRARFGRLTREFRVEEPQVVVDGQLIRFAVPQQSRFGRETLWVDLDGDQRSDAVVANGNSGKIQVLLQQDGGGFGVPDAFGSYEGICQVSAIDWDRDGVLELFLMSQTENQVGVTRWSPSGGVPFPESIETKGTLLGIAASALVSKQGPVLICLERVIGEGFSLVLMGSEGIILRQSLDIETDARRFEIVCHDVDQDGVEDLVLVAPYEPLRVLWQNREAGRFESMRIPSGMGDREQPWVGSLDVDGDGKAELVVPQKNAVRALVVDKGKGASDDDRVVMPRVKVQLNGESDQSVIGGIISIPVGFGERPMACLLDTGSNQLCFQQLGSDGQWRSIETLSLPRGEYFSLNQVLTLGPDQLGLGLLGPTAGFVKSLSGSRWQFDVEGTYETELNGGFLNRCLGADFDGDGSNELVFFETGKHNIELVTTRSAVGLEFLYRWPVFEARSFRNRRGDVSEPREGQVADFTGDGRPDLVVLVHDRVLLYPQL